MSAENPESASSAGDGQVNRLRRWGLPRWLTWSFAAAVLVPTGCLYLGWTCFVLPSVSGYHGEGTFEDISRRAGPFAIPGYSIRMPAFDLGQPFHAEYRLAGLPRIGRECGVYLGIDDPNGWWFLHDTNLLGGAVQLELRDSEGQMLINVDGKLGDYIWYGRRYLHALYQMDKSFFKPDSQEVYRVRVTYSPDPKLAGFKGFVYIECGGHM